MCVAISIAISIVQPCPYFISHPFRIAWWKCQGSEGHRRAAGANADVPTWRHHATPGSDWICIIGPTVAVANTEN